MLMLVVCCRCWPRHAVSQSVGETDTQTNKGGWADEEKCLLKAPVQRTFLHVLHLPNRGRHGRRQLSVEGTDVGDGVVV